MLPATFKNSPDCDKRSRKFFTKRSTVQEYMLPKFINVKRFRHKSNRIRNREKFRDLFSYSFMKSSSNYQVCDIDKNDNLGARVKTNISHPAAHYNHIESLLRDSCSSGTLIDGDIQVKLDEECITCKDCDNGILSKHNMRSLRNKFKTIMHKKFIAPKIEQNPYYYDNPNFGLKDQFGTSDVSSYISDEDILQSINQNNSNSLSYTLNATDKKRGSSTDNVALYDNFVPKYDHSFTLRSPPTGFPKEHYDKWERSQIFRHVASKSKSRQLLVTTVSKPSETSNFYDNNKVIEQDPITYINETASKNPVSLFKTISSNFLKVTTQVSNISTAGTTNVEMASGSRFSKSPSNNSLKPNTRKSSLNLSYFSSLKKKNSNDSTSSLLTKRSTRKADGDSHMIGRNEAYMQPSMEQEANNSDFMF